MEAAVDWLRKKGISKADKKAGRTAAEGLIGVDSGLREAVVVEVNSETDFVARNEAFQEIVRNVAKVALALGGEHRRPSPTRNIRAPTRSVAEAIKDAVGTIGENLSFRRSAKLSVGAGRGRDLCPQRGRRQSRQARRAGGDRDDRRGRGRARLRAPGRDARRGHQPAGADVEELDPAAVERERAIFADQARQSGKPENDHREDGRRPAAQVLRGSRAPEAGLRAQPRRHRREGAEGCREGDRRAGQDHRLSSASRSARASRRKPPTSRPKSRPR